MAFKLAELLLRRKELSMKLERMAPISKAELYEVRVKRINVTDSVDEVTANAPKMSYADFQAEHNHYARQLRVVDAAIQRANWETDVPVEESVMADYAAPAKA